MGELFWTNHRGTREVVPGGEEPGSLSTHIIYPGDRDDYYYGYWIPYYEPDNPLGSISTPFVGASDQDNGRVVLRGVWLMYDPPWGVFLRLSAYPESNREKWAKAENEDAEPVPIYLWFDGDRYEWEDASNGEYSITLDEHHPLALSLISGSPTEVGIECEMWLSQWPS